MQYDPVLARALRASECQTANFVCLPGLRDRRWSGHCDDIPAAADAPTLDELLAKIFAMSLDLLPNNHPDVDPATLFLQIIALREATSAAL
jgi:hypothetical protein